MSRFKFNHLKLATVFGLSLFFVFINAHSQNKGGSCSGRIDTLLHKFVYTSLENMPVPIGGMQKIYHEFKTLSIPSNAKVYSGRIIVAFVVDENGEIEGKRIIKDPSGHVLGDRLLKLVDNMRWKAGSCNGKKVSALYILPMFIDLEE